MKLRTVNHYECLKRIITWSIYGTSQHSPDNIVINVKIQFKVCLDGYTTGWVNLNKVKGRTVQQ